MKKTTFSETVIANSGKIIEYKGKEIKIVNSGISGNGTPYVELDPPHDELRQKMCEELENKGNFTVVLGSPNRIILGCGPNLIMRPDFRKSG